MLNLKRRSLPIRSLVVGSAVGAFALACASVYGGDDSDSFELKVEVSETCCDLIGNLLTSALTREVNNIKLSDIVEKNQVLLSDLGMASMVGVGMLGMYRIEINSGNDFKLKRIEPTQDGEVLADYTLIWGDLIPDAATQNHTGSRGVECKQAFQTDFKFQATSVNLPPPDGTFTDTVTVTCSPQ